MTGLRTVTFDCWGTLLFEPEPAATYARRVTAVAALASRRDGPVEPAEARAALDRAWTRHWILWQEGVASGARQMAAWALEELDRGRTRSGRAGPEVDELAGQLAEASLAGEVRVLEGAGDVLEDLARRGVRRALICDTGFSSGAVVRRILAREGLLELLPVCVFSDEEGVPKPHPRVFARALAALGEGEPRRAAHVGDLRRTDVAGGRGAGMTTFRIRAHYDDTAALPDADRVVDSHAQLRGILSGG